MDPPSSERSRFREAMADVPQKPSRGHCGNGFLDMGSEPTRTAFRSPWQKGVAERWVGSCRRDLLEHVIILNERHLKRLMSLPGLIP